MYYPSSHPSDDLNDHPIRFVVFCKGEKKMDPIEKTDESSNETITVQFLRWRRFLNIVEQIRRHMERTLGPIVHEYQQYYAIIVKTPLLYDLYRPQHLTTKKLYRFFDETYSCQLTTIDVTFVFSTWCPEIRDYFESKRYKHNNLHRRFNDVFRDYNVIIGYEFHWVLDHSLKNKIIYSDYNDVSRYVSNRIHESFQRYRTNCGTKTAIIYKCFGTKVKHEEHSQMFVDSMHSTMQWNRQLYKKWQPVIVAPWPSINKLLYPNFITFDTVRSFGSRSRARKHGVEEWTIDSDELNERKRTRSCSHDDHDDDDDTNDGRNSNERKKARKTIIELLRARYPLYCNDDTKDKASKPGIVLRTRVPLQSLIRRRREIRKTNLRKYFQQKKMISLSLCSGSRERERNNENSDDDDSKQTTNSSTIDEKLLSHRNYWSSLLRNYKKPIPFKETSFFRELQYYLAMKRSPMANDKTTTTTTTTNIFHPARFFCTATEKYLIDIDCDTELLDSVVKFEKFFQAKLQIAHYALSPHIHNVSVVDTPLTMLRDYFQNDRIAERLFDHGYRIDPALCVFVNLHDHKLYGRENDDQ